jgi:Fe-S-cluster-containing hydrogenase component 2
LKIKLKGLVFMSEINLLIDYSLCTGCKICQLACSEKKCGYYIPNRALLKIEEHDEIYHTPVVCMHCGNPACMKVCPSGAIMKDGRGVILDSDKCTGCGLCQKYCPQHVIVIYQNDDSKRKAHKCDLCSGSPKCAEVCPTGAISIVRRIK